MGHSGGLPGVRDLGDVASATFQPRVTVGGEDAYPTLIEKAAALGFSLMGNHGFVDGNKRVAHASMETFLMLNGFEISADVDEQEAKMLALAAGALSRDQLVEWLRRRVIPRRGEN